MITARLLARVLMQKKAWSIMYHSCLTLMLTQQSSGAGLPLNLWVDSPIGGMWAPLPDVPSCSATTPADIKGLLLFSYVTPVPFLLSQEGDVEKQNATSQQLTLCYRWVRGVQVLRGSGKIYCQCAAKTSFWKQEEKQTNTSKLCRQWEVFAGDINRIRWSQHNRANACSQWCDLEFLISSCYFIILHRLE